MKLVIKESQLNLLTETLTFREVYKDTFPFIFNSVCMKFAKGDYDLAQEYCQTGYIRVYNQLNTFKGESNINTWVKKVIINSLDRLEESSFLQNPEEKKYMLSIEKSEKFSKILTKALEKNPIVSEVEVVEYPADGFYETTTYKIKVFLRKSEITDIHKDVKVIYTDLKLFLQSVLNNKLQLRDSIKFEVE